MADNNGSGALDELKENFSDVVKALGEKAMGSVGDRVGGLTDKLTDIADGGPLGKATAEGAKSKASGDSAVGGALKGGLSGLKDKAKDVIPGMSGGGGGGGKATKSTNIVETIDVGVPVSVAYNAWTEYNKWPDFMKKVESAKQEEDEPKVSMKAQIVWSHRSWDATIKQQVPDEMIVWRSKGEKGHVDGSVTFHEIGPRLTRILVVLEYYPQGLFEKTGNIWRAQGRRARAEIKHFRRHVMMNTILDPDEVQGWRGEIHDEEVTKSHDEVVEQEEQESEEQDSEGEYEDDEPEGQDDDEAPEGEYEDEDEESEEEPEDEYEDEGEEEPEDEYEDEEEEGEEEPEDEYEDEEEDEGEEEPEDEYDEEAQEEDGPEDEEPEEEEPRRTRKKSTSRRSR